MSGHYMSTVNPEAAGSVPAAPNPDVDQHTVEAVTEFKPEIGAIVIYICRPGEGRAGKHEFPAMVMHHEPQGGVSLLVIYDVDDMVIRPNIRQASGDLSWPAWRLRKQDTATIVVEEPFEPSRLNHMRRDLDRMREGIYGSYEEPGKSVMEFLVSFEETLAKLDKRLKALEKKKQG